jgi:hypothetical protein
MRLLKLSGPRASGIPAGMSKVAVVALLAIVVGGAACDVRPLTSRELYGAAGTSGRAGTGGVAGTSGAAGTSGVAGAGGEGGAAGTGGATPDGGAGTGMPDATVSEPAPEAPVSACGAPCPPTQFCDELTVRCVDRAGTSHISGQVYDACSNDIIDALVGIAGQHACAYQRKGAFYFTGIPVGPLKLSAAKEGYVVYGEPVDIPAAGLVKDIYLMREGGCMAPRPMGPLCTCPTGETCQP